MKLVRDILLCGLVLAGVLHAFGQAERKVVQGASPDSPSIAVRMNLHGTVKLKIWITPDGTVRRLEYVGGHPLLAESALQAVKGWRYATAAKETTQIVELKF